MSTALPLTGSENDIAIVGMAAHLPGADSILAYWDNLRAGRSSIRRLTEDELRAAVGRYWSIDEIRPAFIHANMPDTPEFSLPDHQRDDRGRMMMPAFLLTAHKPA